MPMFRFYFDRVKVAEDVPELEFSSLEQAYLEVCAAIPDFSRDLLLEGRDPLKGSVVICDAKNNFLMKVPFSEVLSPAEWKIRTARRRPHGGPRSTRARNDLALSSFRQMFSAVNAGCVLLTPELTVVEMNDFGARHSHVDPESIRGLPITEIFSELRDQPKDDFHTFMSLAQAGVTSEVVDLPYLVLGAEGQTLNGWWNARTWPIFDDDQHMIGFVEWAEPHEKPTRGEGTRVKVSKMVA